MFGDKNYHMAISLIFLEEAIPLQITLSVLVIARRAPIAPQSTWTSAKYKLRIKSMIYVHTYIYIYIHVFVKICILRLSKHGKLDKKRN